MHGSLPKATAYIEVDGRAFRLAHDRDLVELMARVEAITRSESAFIDLSDGEQLVSVLISPGARVVVTVRPGDPATGIEAQRTPGHSAPVRGLGIAAAALAHGGDARPDRGRRRGPALPGAFSAVIIRSTLCGSIFARGSVSSSRSRGMLDCIYAVVRPSWLSLASHVILMLS